MSALKYFYFVAYYGNMSRAADKLCVTHGAVSKQIKKLESHLGIELFAKQGRALVLTAEGDRLFKTCQPLFAELESILTQLTEQKQLSLVVSCEPTIAMKWLIPRSAKFKAIYGIDMVLLAAGGSVDFTKQRIDVAIRRDDFDWPDSLFGYYLADEQIGMVQSYQCQNTIRLHTHTRPNAWQDWLKLQLCPDSGQGFKKKSKKDLESEKIGQGQVNEAVYFEHFYLSLQAANAGLGQAIASRLMVQDDIDQQVLNAPLGFLPDGSKYYLLSESPIESNENKASFLKWLQEEMALTMMNE